MTPAAAIAPDLTAGKSFLWSFPGAPVRIHLDLHAADRLQTAVRAATRENSHAEIGGLLLGVAESPMKIHITGFQPLDWPSGDAEFRLRAPKAGAAREEVVGFYRSHLREGLKLDEMDVRLFARRFGKMSDVALLVKPMPDGSTSAGFFFWDNGTIESRYSFHEFPFDPERLAKEVQEQSVAVAPPISPRFATQPVKPETPAMMPASPAIQRGKGLSVLVVSAMLAIFIAGLSLGYLVSEWHSRTRRNALSLGLRVQQQGRDLRFTWEKGAPVLRSGNARGVLTILDHGVPPRILPLGPEELVTPGSITYFPRSGQVQFRLEVHAADATVTDSVVALAPGPLASKTGARTKSDNLPVEGH